MSMRWNTMLACAFFSDFGKAFPSISHQWTHEALCVDNALPAFINVCLGMLQCAYVV